MKKEADVHSDKQQIYNRDYFETRLKTASQPYSYNNKRRHFEIVLNTLAQLKPKKVLDIGCAKGFLVYLFNQTGIQSYGMNVSRYAIENAPDKIKNRLSVVNIENDRFPYEEKYFDLIIGLDTLEHLGNFKNMLKECDRVLRKGGYLFFTTPVPRSWDATHDITHINIHPRVFWIKLFREYGFLPLDRESYSKLIREFVKNYKKIISLAPSDRHIIKFLSKFGWLGKFIRRELQVYVNFCNSSALGSKRVTARSVSDEAVFKRLLRKKTLAMTYPSGHFRTLNCYKLFLSLEGYRDTDF